MDLHCGGPPAQCRLHRGSVATGSRHRSHPLVTTGTRASTSPSDVPDAQDQNLKRVNPPGSTPSTTVAERGSMRYTCHGGGPCAGALKGAVIPVPLGSG